MRKTHFFFFKFQFIIFANKLQFLSFSLLDLLINKDCIRKSITYSDYVLKLNNDTLEYSCAGLDTSVSSTELSRSTQNTELISQALGYIYLSCQRNKLLHGCLLPSILVHAIKRNSKISECRNVFELISKLLIGEFIYDPDLDINQVCLFFSVSYAHFYDLYFVSSKHYFFMHFIHKISFSP